MQPQEILAVPAPVICEAGLATVAIQEQPYKADAAFAPG